jgi:hypothetical protein
MPPNSLHYKKNARNPDKVASPAAYFPIPAIPMAPEACLFVTVAAAAEDVVDFEAEEVTFAGLVEEVAARTVVEWVEVELLVVIVLLEALEDTRADVG